MKIWVDADACPKVIKEILYRAAKRESLQLILVANQPLRTPQSDYISTILVADGFDVADEEIIGQVMTGDLVITADIPLAAAIIEKGAFALNPRGTFYTNDNVREILTVRNFMDELRKTGVNTGGPAAFNRRDRESFANALDCFLNKKQFTD